ncbi:HD domain-containing protein [Rudanella paleaurantiibacter]|uniref:HD domain-containing protein n=1 Tax=Rudanella paleaurantiibacter TaxID=2614655 RepID=A0A7J5TYQ6_9BACT|nr:HD domain-containing protein [Rudanella paleaurantiibacter]KAB7730195.1 HD domain-containing protein [Rudanella paleaurantiibacter]
MTPDQTIPQLRALFDQQGQDPYFGEPVTQLEHALQCAALAERAGSDNDTVVAAFLHDIGHLLPVESAEAYMDGYGTVDHERLGADHLRALGFSEKTAVLIENHVNAKRYLVTKFPEYDARLSDASRQTLAFQGGPMSADEMVAFEANPYFHEILALRRWDEEAKEVGFETPSPDYYFVYCRDHLSR